MPKGDIARLKADPEDGTVPVARLFLDALALCRLSALELCAVLFLMRQTYGWTDREGRRYKERAISRADWASHLGVDNYDTSNIRRMLRGLVDKRIIVRTPVTTGRGGYTYRMNTLVSQWHNTCIDKDALRTVVAPSTAAPDPGPAGPGSSTTKVSDDPPRVPETHVPAPDSPQNQKTPPGSLCTLANCLINL
jgi:hypothetical protein